MFYPLVVSSTAALAVTADLALAAPPRAPGPVRAGGGRRPTRAVTAATLLTAAALVADGGVWAHVHTRHDDAYRRTVAWTDTHLPLGSTVAATDETPPFLVRGAQSGTWNTVRDLQDHHVDYLVLSSQLVAQGYAHISPGLLATLEQRAVLVHSEPGPTAGALRVYDVRALLAAQNGRTG
jgi:hypothetical protein